VGKPVMHLISLPVERELQKFYDRRVQKVLARLEQDPALREANRPTAFVREGFYREQLLAALRGQPAAVVNRFPNPTTEADEAGGPPNEKDRVIPEGDVYKLWVRHEEPLRDAALRQKAEQHVGRRPNLKTLSLTEGMMVYFKVATVCGVVLGCPWIFWQLWAFVAAGLYGHEKRGVRVYLPFSLGLFLAGIALCELWVLPRSIEALLWFNEWLDLEPDLRLSEWLGFAVLMPLVFGLAFQTPLVMLFLERLGVLDAGSYRKKRILAWFLLAVFAAIATPSPDAWPMLMLWLPMGCLYELGILLCRVFPHRQDQPDLGVPGPEEMVEV
ncbi:MAG TPA: twin-arginine translocase subunit TatC, partial [Gemmataceae bacterium]|nr:twin-arginine translocase subunit TatC [Gemmataceae bacterium]